MKLSTVTRYGLRALSDLSAREGEGPVTVGDIAHRQGIPSSYLEQLFARLRRGHLIKSVRGAQGGYLLARPARDITVAEVVRALGEPIAFGDCQTNAGCAHEEKCVVHGLWQKLKDSVDDILESTTLEDIVRGKNDEMPDRRKFSEAQKNVDRKNAF